MMVPPEDETTDDPESRLIEILKASPPIVCRVLRVVSRVAPYVPLSWSETVAAVVDAVHGVCCEHDGEQRAVCLDHAIDAAVDGD